MTSFRIIRGFVCQGGLDLDCLFDFCPIPTSSPPPECWLCSVICAADEGINTGVNLWSEPGCLLKHQRLRCFFNLLTLLLSGGKFTFLCLSTLCWCKMAARQRKLGFNSYWCECCNSYAFTPHTHTFIKLLRAKEPAHVTDVCAENPAGA